MIDSAERIPRPANRAIIFPGANKKPFPAMADEIPQGLKQADINLYKTATRAAQLSTVKPIIAYWCMCPLLPQVPELKTADCS